MSPSNAYELANFSSGISTVGSETIVSGINFRDLPDLTISGITTIGGDVSIADKIVHIGDADTAIRFPSADTITAETGGTERLRIDSSGNINVAGVATFSGNVSVAGVLTYEDVTNVDSIGIITARSDVSISDKIVHTGDTNTTIRFPSADTITAETGGTERLRITSNGKIGIGTIIPNSTLHIQSTSGSTTQTFTSPSGQPNKIQFRLNNGTLDAEIKNELASLIFATGTSSTARLTIDADGDLIQASHKSFWQKNGTTPFLISTGDSTPTVYVSDSGNDSTGDGTTSNPYRTITQAWNHIPKVYSHSNQPRILIKGTSYTVDTSHYARGGGSGGNFQWGPAIDIKSESGSQIDVYLRSTLLFESVDGLRFQNLNFICDTSGGHLSFTNCKRGKIYTSCDMNVTATSGWSMRTQYIQSSFKDEMDIAVASTASSGLGALVTVYNSTVDGLRSITKAGSQWGNAAVAVVDGSIFTGQWSVDNFNTGIRFGLNHYNAEIGGSAVLNGITISNCNRGLDLYNNSFVRKYSTTYTSNTTNEVIQTGSFIN